ncbi:cobyrinate a,c-diamide synthase [Noviherbaspirillum sp. 1P10PC]|uniref:cobyrinate a,c-diamide synthase n=1 Tax=Noviherbaspirillum sp. 1P10PC TaxID=3132292 RepID=UPI0039A08295
MVAPRRAGAVAALVSATASGQGKTTVTAALARLLARRGLAVRVFKAGPDFIDPVMLERAAGSAVYNLDLWMVGAEASRAMLAQAAGEADVILIEGVMGLYDGTPSSADLARAFDVPVLAVLDASAMAQTAGAVALGLRDYGPVQMAGVIANRVAGSGHAAMVAQSLRDMPLLASLPRQAASLPERHLGLVLPGEVDALDALLDGLADALHLDDAAWDALPTASLPAASPQALPPLLQGKRIAVARDAAFAFLYRANLDCLRGMGAAIRYFSPLADEPVPEDADAIWLPGGYPELHGAALAGGSAWQASLRRAHADGKPMLAECGGLMAVCESLVDKNGQPWPMAGLLPARTRMQTRLAALGLQGWQTAHGELRGHAFHYSTLEGDIAAAGHARRHPSGGGGEAIYRAGSLTASYFHAYFPSYPQAAAALLGGAA